MNKKLLIAILGLVLFMIVPNPAMAQITNYPYGHIPQPSYIESHYNIKTCDSTFQYKFLCDRVDIMIQQNDQIITNQNTIKIQNDQIISLGKAQVCMTGYASHGNFIDFAARVGVNCNIGNP